MPANHESTLWIVPSTNRKTGKGGKVYLFRTRDAARRFYKIKNARAKLTKWWTPRRVQWGPE